MVYFRSLQWNAQDSIFDKFIFKNNHGAFGEKEIVKSETLERERDK